MSITPQTLTLASPLDAWLYGKDYFPCFFNTCKYINLDETLNHCILADGTLLKDADANTNLGKAYRYWYMAPSDTDEWANLGVDAPDEVALVGRYLQTVTRINGEIACQNDPAWIRRDFGCCKKMATVCLVAGIIGLFSLGIFLTFKYSKK
jgi:hypothetical protein